MGKEVISRQKAKLRGGDFSCWAGLSTRSVDKRFCCI